jgi:hypothetical protein
MQYFRDQLALKRGKTSDEFSDDQANPENLRSSVGQIQKNGLSKSVNSLPKNEMEQQIIDL